jgi:CrcB protein
VLAAIATGGALGGVARYEVSLAHPNPPGGFPWATWAINVSGSFLLAVIVTLVVERWPPTRYVRPFLGIGFCGGYTTWSTAMTDTVLLVRDHHAQTAVTYLAASLAAGLAATVAGIWLTRARPRRPRRRSA